MEQHQTKADYEVLLDRLHNKLGTTAKKEVSRLELPVPQIIWVGQRTIFRNFMDFPKALRREPEKLLLYLNKELASAGYINGDRVIFLGRKVRSSFGALIDRYVKDYVICPVCGSPDTRTEKNKKLFSFLFSKCMYEYLYSICCLILFSICPFGNAPTITSITCPSLMIIRVGIL